MAFKEINCTKEEVYNYLINSKNKKEFVSHFGYKDGRAAKKVCERFELNLNDLGKICGRLGQPLENGQVFGKLTVIDANCGVLGNERKPETASLCQCECGEQLMVRNDFLKRGHTKSCGCTSGRNKGHQIKEGEVFNELTVLKPNVFLDAHGDQNCLCKCSCGKILTVKNTCLRRGQVSCGHIVSKGERKIEQIFMQEKFNYETQYSFPDLKGDCYPLRFDFAIFDDKNKLIALIEYQGSQHYRENIAFSKKTLEYDKRKREYCRLKNIRLIEIPHTDYDDINKKYLEELIFYE